MFSDFKFTRGYCIYVLVTYAPILVHTLKECSKKDVCICSTDEGVIDLRSLAGTGSDIPRLETLQISLSTLALARKLCFLSVFQRCNACQFDKLSPQRRVSRGLY